MPLVLMVVAMAVLATLAASVTGRRVIDRQRAQTAADASALAGVTGGQAAAARLAGVNGAVLVRFAAVPAAAADGGAGAVTVEVTVSVDGVMASARATNGP